MISLLLLLVLYSRLFDATSNPILQHVLQSMVVAVVYFILNEERVCFLIHFWRIICNGGFITPVKAFDQVAAKPHLQEQSTKERRERDGHAQLDIEDSPCAIESGNDAKEKANSTEEKETWSSNGFAAGCIGVIVRLSAHIHGSLSC
jgi:hypothetical protein